MSVGEAVPTGNTFDKYGSSNPVVRRLMAGFEGTLDRLFEHAAPQSVLDVGCGEGVLTYGWAQRLGDAPVLGLDLEDPKLRAEWETRRRDNLRFATMPPDRLPCDDDEFDLATAIEVLEHVPDPEQTVSRDGARGPPPPARVGAPRAAVARSEHGARGIPPRTRQHARPRQSLHKAGVCVHCWRGTARSWRSARRFRGR